MVDYEPPSFSLGLDLDLEPEPDPPNQPTNPITNQKCEEDEPGIQLRVSDSEPESPGPPLRRLRRGGPSSSKPISPPNPIVDDDDIEDFSSQEDLHLLDDLPATRHNTLCSTSKIPLSGCGVLTSQQDSETTNKKRKQDSNCLPSTTSSIDVNKGKSVLSDFSASPLRRFQLLDSDSDFEEPSESVGKKDTSVNGFPNQNATDRSTQQYSQITNEKKTNSPTLVSKKKDLWEFFYEDKSRSLPTPAFDEFFEEYNNSIKQKRGASGPATEYFSSAQKKKLNTTSKMTQQDQGSAGPPSHQYFFHDDLRIQNLVRSRLSYFCPLGASGDTRSILSNASTIDYMSQFGHGDGTKQQTGTQGNGRKSSRSSRKKTNNGNVESTSHASGDWINPKLRVSTPKDAGRRRVHAEGRSAGAGHWFTGEDGKKVYVNSKGQELTGQMAYRHYKKESGKGFKRAKKKQAAKKKK